MLTEIRRKRQVGYVWIKLGDERIFIRTPTVYSLKNDYGVKHKIVGGQRWSCAEIVQKATEVFGAIGLDVCGEEKIFSRAEFEEWKRKGFVE